MNSGICGYPPLDETVDRMRLRRLARDGATANQVLKWNGSVWAPGTDLQGGGGGAFTDLTDTPATLQSNAFPRVNAPGSALVWRGAEELRADIGLALPPQGRIEIFSDFITAGSVLPFTSTATGSGSAVSALSTVASVPGQRTFGHVALDTGTTATGLARLQWGSTNATGWTLVRFNDGAEKRYFTRVMMPTLPDATNAFDLRLGLAASSDGTSNFIRIVGGWNSSPQNRWILHSRRSNTDTFLDSGVSWTANEWYELEFRIPASGGSVEFFVNGSSVGTITTNVPTDSATSGTFIAENLKSAGTTSRILIVDYLGLLVIGSRS